MVKKIICIALASCMAALSLTGCISAKPQEPAQKTEFKKPVKAADMLYEVTYDDYPSQIPDDSDYEMLTGELACSGVRNGNFLGRNFDFFMNTCPTFVIRTTAKEGRYASIGVGRLSGIDSDDADGGLSQKMLDILPWSILDGINEKGLVVTSNVVTKADGGDIPHTGTIPGEPGMNVVFVIRALLDNCADADEAVEYLKNHNITAMPSEMFDLHLMISDPEKTYVAEFINNEVAAEEQNIMTNYHVNLDDIPEHPIGLERMQILKEHYDEGNTMEGMYSLMQRVSYTKSYYASNKWYSDLGLTKDQLENISEEAEAYLQMEQAQYEEELEYLKEHGLRETTEWWDTTHNTTYDIENKKIWVTVHERYEEGPHEFSLSL